MGKQILIDPLSAVALSLQCTLGTVPFTGTGFVVQKNGQKYLITNWHMLTGRHPETGQPLSPTGAADPTSIGIWHHDANQLGAWNLKTEALIDPNDGQKKWLEHPSGHHIDVVALPITVQSDVKVYPLDLNLSNTDLIVMPSDPVSIVGFPLGMASAGKFPIWKTGHVASEIDLDYANKPVFLIDATTKSGMSGSPVIAKRSGFVRTSKGWNMGVEASRFLGVYSGRIQDQSDVGMVWKPEVVQQILP
jgi:V8-like Glu-specific endopeptidase